MFEWILSREGYLTINLIIYIYGTGLSLGVLGQKRTGKHGIAGVILCVLFAIWTWLCLR